MTPVRTAARALLASIFVTSGAQAITKPSLLVDRAKPVTDQVTPLFAKSRVPLPTETRTLVQLNGAVHVVGGLALLTPLRRVAGVALAASLVPTTLAGHPFWKFDDPADRAAQRVHFFKNMGLIGGTLLAALDNEGQPGIRWRAGRLASDTSRAVQRTTTNAKSKANIARKSAMLGRKSAGAGSVRSRRS